MTRQLLFTTALAAGLALAGCNKTPEPPKTETDAAATGDVVTASSNPTVGGAEMLATRTIVENASASPIHKTLVAAVKQAGLVETLSGPYRNWRRLAEESVGHPMPVENSTKPLRAVHP